MCKYKWLKKPEIKELLSEHKENSKGNDKSKNTIFKIKMGENIENNTNSWHFDETQKLLNTWQDLSIKEQSPIKYSAIRKFIKQMTNPRKENTVDKHRTSGLGLEVFQYS